MTVASTGPATGPVACPRGTGAGAIGLFEGSFSYSDSMELEFSGEVWEWRGPSPFFFVSVPEEESAQLQAASALVTYGWGMIPVDALVGSTRWTTSLFPKDGGYVVPLKDAVRRAESIDVGVTLTVRLEVSL